MASLDSVSVGMLYKASIGFPTRGPATVVGEYGHEEGKLSGGGLEAVPHAVREGHGLDAGPEAESPDAKGSFPTRPTDDTGTRS